MDLPELVCRYADRFAALGRGEHHVSSPLAAWLVLALAAPAAREESADRLTDVLGTDLETAHRAATRLLAESHPAVSAAAAAWADPGLTGLAPWLATLPDTVETGAIPTRAQADEWARDHTFGLIEKFPISPDNILILLASALATRVTWLEPFELAAAPELRGPWSTRLSRVLRTPRGHAGQRRYITDTARAGRVAVHAALADGLEVTSVIADASVAAADVLAAAHEVVLARAEPGGTTQVSLFDLPLGDHPLWTITEEQASARGERLDALLPAWHAESTHELLSVPGLGFDVAGAILQRLADVTDGIDAKQTAVARYTRYGFEAAAVTGLAIPASAVMRQPGPFRTGTVRFGHPYAVVAAASGPSGSPWNGLPVFAAWITEPDDANDEGSR